MDETYSECACGVLDTVPMVMWAIRAEMRSHRTAGLSVPQFRTLAFLDQHGGASLSEAAEHLGLTLSSTSRLVDLLVERGLATRQEDANDRRRLVLHLTEPGRAVLAVVYTATQHYLEERLASLSPEQCALVTAAMGYLRLVFGLPVPEQAAAAACNGGPAEPEQIQGGGQVNEYVRTRN
jgi:DNA-binding MarR family transcriptional regulator